MKIAPSILAADLSDLARVLRMCESGEADMVHVDVMDGHFVPNLTIGVPVVEALSRRTRLPLDVHLMVANPDRLLEAYLAAGAARLSIHWEATPNVDRLLSQIRQGGAKAGVAVNPGTPVEQLVDVLSRADFILLMSVNPGFSGQKFLPHVAAKAERLRAMIRQAGLPVEIEMDGGLGADNIASVVESGVDICVVGSGIFAAEDPVEAMLDLRKRAAKV